MKIELIIIASEILNGKILDLNTKWLARFLLPLGFTLNKVVTISDEKDLMLKTFKDSWENSDIVITSGGLGPTKDDLTKLVVNEFFNDQIMHSDIAKKIVIENYARFKRTFDETKSHYTYVPSTAIIFNNPAGMAPGLGMSKLNKFFCSLPGVPHEFQNMFAHEIFPFIKNKYQLNKQLQKLVTVKTKMLPESKIFSEICPTLWEDLEKFGAVSSLPHPMGVDIGVTITDESPELLKNREQQVLDIIFSTPLPPHIWHIGHKSLEEVIIEEASAKNLTIATAESCTGGLIASRLTDVSGSSKVFLGSVVSYANSIKEDLLFVNAITLKNFGAVSVETASEMAIGIQKQTKASITIATSGIAGPSGGTEEKPVGTICIAIQSKNLPKTNIYNLSGDRIKLKERFSQIALYNLLDEIRGY